MRPADGEATADWLFYKGTFFKSAIGAPFPWRKVPWLGPVIEELDQRGAPRDSRLAAYDAVF